MELNIGTRGSKLALAQSRWVKQMVEHRHPDVRVNLVRIKTKGDRVLDAPLSRIGGKGLFVKEIEEALLEGRVDVAVHSMKDVPAELPEGLFLCAFPEREDPRDAVVSTGGLFFGDLPRGARVGTSSLRRTAQEGQFHQQGLGQDSNNRAGLHPAQTDDFQHCRDDPDGQQRAGMRDKVPPRQSNNRSDPGHNHPNEKCICHRWKQHM